jgi:hypothetical protein
MLNALAVLVAGVIRTALNALRTHQGQADSVHPGRNG